MTTAKTSGKAWIVGPILLTILFAVSKFFESPRLKGKEFHVLLADVVRDEASTLVSAHNSFVIVMDVPIWREKLADAIFQAEDWDDAPRTLLGGADGSVEIKSDHGTFRIEAHSGNSQGGILIVYASGKTSGRATLKVPPGSLDWLPELPAMLRDSRWP